VVNAASLRKIYLLPNLSDAVLWKSVLNGFTHYAQNSPASAAQHINSDAAGDLLSYAAIWFVPLRPFLF
jgi:hypothetical protein